MKKSWRAWFIQAVTVVSPLCFAFVGACDDSATGPDDAEVESTLDDTAFEPTDWTTATHSNDAAPDFDEVFPDHAVNRIDIVITEERWALMMADMESKYGPLGGGSGGPVSSSDENPIFVPAEVFYDGRQWYRVGVRFKGNSSLSSTWGSGILKLSFKLDFDEFEDTYPQIEDQRFYGFRQLSLKNNYDDPSMLREKVAGDIFRSAGLAASRTAFYTLYVDYGEGPVYFGVYTMVEEVDDTVLDTQFPDGGGNLYKPEGSGASFREGSFSEASFAKETNEDEADWSDVQALFAALHDDSRTTDDSAWRAGLEAVFDVDKFLRYLATNTVIQNWDTYGRMTQNYFLYNVPTTGLLTWIPWDNNEALRDGKRGGSLALDFSDLTSNEWPLIEYLYDDAVYRARYDANVEDIINGPFETGSMQATYGAYATLVEPYATTETSGFSFLRSSAEFSSAIATLESHAAARAAAASLYLSR